MAENGSVESRHPGGLTETPCFTDERLIRLVTEYDRLGGELEALGRLRRSYEKAMREATASGEPGYASVAEYNRRREEAEAAHALAGEESRRAAQREEEIRRRRVEILEGLYAAGMPPGKWFRHGDEAVLLEREVVPADEGSSKKKKKSSLSPQSRQHDEFVLRLRRALWEVVLKSNNNESPQKLEGRSHEIEARRTMAPWRRAAKYRGVAGYVAAPIICGGYVGYLLHELFVANYPNTFLLVGLPFTFLLLVCAFALLVRWFMKPRRLPQETRGTGEIGAAKR